MGTPHHQAVEVTALGDGTYRVRVGGRTEHEVAAPPEVLDRVRRAAEAPEDTIARAFDFLLEREPPAAILRRFALDDIARYFPEFWTAMR